jgi:DNA-3-methyladenine glycosylase I
MRCFGDGNPLYESYHDREWGRPVRDERGLFERICLESFQTGISWLIVLRKRDRFREVFGGFDPDLVAGYGDGDVARLLDDPGIVRNRAKIQAAIANARATVALRDTPAPLEELVWSFRPEPKPAPVTFAEVPSVTPESTALSVALKSRGFRFVGPTTAYALMQACGLVNDHLAECRVRREMDSPAGARAHETRPPNQSSRA